MSDRLARRIYLTLAEGQDLSSDDAAHLAACPTCQAAADHARAFEHDLHRELVGLHVPMPADPFAVTETSRTWRPVVPGLAFGLVVLVAGLFGAGLLAAPNPGPSPEPSAAQTASAPAATARPSASPAPTQSPTASPAASPASSASGPALEPGDYALGSLAELTLYDRPNGTPFAQASPGSELYVIGVEDGWVEVQAPQPSSLHYVFGWVQAPALEQHVPSPCLEGAPGAYLWFGSANHPQRNVDCYGDAGQLVAQGYAIDRSGDDPRPYAGEPAWLAGPPTLELSSAIGPAVTGFSLSLHLPPELEGTIPTSDREAHEGTLLSVTGHFDDSRSSECAMAPVAEGYPAVEPKYAELWCRQRFVVDAVEIVEPGN